MSAGTAFIQREKMTLDLSKLSPMFRRRVAEWINREAYRESCDMENVLPQYSEGETKEEMAGWLKALKELEVATREIRKES